MTKAEAKKFLKEANKQIDHEMKKKKSGFLVTGCKIQNKLEPLTRILFFFIAVVNYS